MLGSGFHCRCPLVAAYPRSEPVCMTRPVSDAASNSHPVAAHIGRTNIPLASGEGSGGRDHSLLRLFKPGQISVRSPGSTELMWPRKIEGETFFFRRPLLGSFQHNPGGHIFPEGDQQLSRQGNDQHFPNSATIELYALMKHRVISNGADALPTTRRAGSWLFVAAGFRLWRRLVRARRIRSARASAPIRHKRQPAVGWKSFGTTPPTTGHRRIPGQSLSNSLTLLLALACLRPTG